MIHMVFKGMELDEVIYRENIENKEIIEMVPSTPIFIGQEDEQEPAKETEGWLIT